MGGRVTIPIIGHDRVLGYLEIRSTDQRGERGYVLTGWTSRVEAHRLNDSDEIIKNASIPFIASQADKQITM